VPADDPAASLYEVASVHAITRDTPKPSSTHTWQAPIEWARYRARLCYEKHPSPGRLLLRGARDDAGFPKDLRIIASTAGKPLAECVVKSLVDVQFMPPKNGIAMPIVLKLQFPES